MAPRINQINTDCLYEPTRCYSVKSLHQIVKQAFNAEITHYKYRRFDPWCGSSSVYNVATMQSNNECNV